MKKSRVTETQIIGILMEADAGATVQDLCRKHGIISPKYYKWRSKNWKQILLNTKECTLNWATKTTP